jgi:hypothetical protein
VLVSEKITRDGEEVLVYGTPEKLVFIGKNPREPRKKRASCLGEGTGIILYAPEDHKLIQKHMKILLDVEAATCEQSSGNQPFEQIDHEALTQKLVENTCVGCITFSGDIPFIEVDTPEDYRAAREEYYPAVLRMEQDKEQ